MMHFCVLSPIPFYTQSDWYKKISFFAAFQVMHLVKQCERALLPKRTSSNTLQFLSRPLSSISSCVSVCLEIKVIKSRKLICGGGINHVFRDISVVEENIDFLKYASAL